MAVITISREYGSQGNAIARFLCERLGYHYFDKHLMLQLGAQLGLPLDEIARLPEDKRYHAQGIVERLLATTPLPTISGDLGWSWTARAQAEEQTLRLSVHTVERLIRAAHDQDKVVVVGRGGQVVLQDLPNVVHVRVVAPIGQRVERIAQLSGRSADAARELVQRRDHAARDYVQSFYAVDWNDPLLYDLVINTGKLTAAVAVELMSTALDGLPVSPTPEMSGATA